MSSSTEVAVSKTSLGASGYGKLKLYASLYSTCACRVEIALNLKELDYDFVPVSNQERKSPDFLQLNPIGSLPVLVDADIVVRDSFGILLYLDGKYPEPPLLPQDLREKALNFEAASIILSSIRPTQILTTPSFICEKLGLDAMLDWAVLLLRSGFAELEKLLKNQAGTYAIGDEVSLADLMVAPEINAAIIFFRIDMNNFPTLLKLYKSYQLVPAFKSAMPAKLPQEQPEAPPQEQPEATPQEQPEAPPQEQPEAPPQEQPVPQEQPEATPQEQPDTTWSDWVGP